MSQNEEKTQQRLYNHDEEELPSLLATFDTENLYYYQKYPTAKEDETNSSEQQQQQQQQQQPQQPQQPQPQQVYHRVGVPIKYATSTRGRNLTHGTTDSTGIMLWPASHLLCQYIIWNSSSPNMSETLSSQEETQFVLGKSVIELGSGCGVVSVTAALHRASPFIICTDIDLDALQIAQENINLNHLDDHQGDDFISVRRLAWGDSHSIQQILSSLPDNASTGKFDTVMAADIVYPATCGETLKLLFQTVGELLIPNGKFLLSFVTRDGHHTPMTLIEAASLAGYKIDTIPSQLFVPPLDKKSNSKDQHGNNVTMPPMLDAKLLVLTKDVNHARQWNDNLGEESCHVFPGLKLKAQRALEDDSSVEEWEPPYCDDDLNSD